MVEGYDNVLWWVIVEEEEGKWWWESLEGRELRKFLREYISG